MEKLFGTTILKENLIAEPEIILKVKEFVLVFYGGCWDPRCQEVAKGLNSYLQMANKVAEDGTVHRRVSEVVYVSNDSSLKDFETFVGEQS